MWVCVFCILIGITRSYETCEGLDFCEPVLQANAYQACDASSPASRATSKIALNLAPYGFLKFITGLHPGDFASTIISPDGATESIGVAMGQYFTHHVGTFWLEIILSLCLLAVVGLVTIWAIPNFWFRKKPRSIAADDNDPMDLYWSLGLVAAIFIIGLYHASMALGYQVNFFQDINGGGT